MSLISAMFRQCEIEVGWVTYKIRTRARLADLPSYLKHTTRSRSLEGSKRPIA